jgi:spermidine synthase
MPDQHTSTEEHVVPYVFELGGAKALHFSIHEVQSRMLVDDPWALELEYTRTMMGFLLFEPQPRRIAMIGLGGGSLAKFCHHHLPEARIKVVEINPHVLDLRQVFHVPDDDDRFSVELGDGARMVQDEPDSCDVLLVDGFDPYGLPDELSSQAFYDGCFDMLHEGGLMVANLHRDHPGFDALVDRIRLSFANAVLVVHTPDKESTNCIVFAAKGDVIDTFRPGVVRAPKGLGADASNQLLAAFSMVMAALKQQRNSLAIEQDADQARDSANGA